MRRSQLSKRSAKIERRGNVSLRASARTAPEYPEACLRSKPSVSARALTQVVGLRKGSGNASTIGRHHVCRGGGQPRTFPAKPDARVRFAPIVLQNSFWGCVKNFLGSLMRSPGNYVGGHMIDPISNRESS